MSGITLKKHKFGILPVNVLLFFFHQEPLLKEFNYFELLLFFFFCFELDYLYIQINNKKCITAHCGKKRARGKDQDPAPQRCK